MPTTFIKNEEIYYSQLGNTSSAYTLLFIHGASSNNDSLKLLASKLPDYHCITIDLPCHGKSKGAVRKSVEAYADFIEDFLTVLQEQHIISQHVTLIGCSMGGFISLELGIRQFPCVKRLIILSSGADPASHCKIIPYITNSTPDTFDPKPLLAQSFDPNTPAEYVDSILNMMVAQGLPSNEVCYYDFATAQHFNKLEQVKEISLPTLVFIGDSDSIIPPICAFNLKENIPHCNLAILPFRGHTLFLETSDYICKLISDFFKLHP